MRSDIAQLFSSFACRSQEVLVGRGSQLVRDGDHSLESVVACEVQIALNLLAIKLIRPCLYFHEGAAVRPAACDNQCAIRPRLTLWRLERRLDERLDCPRGCADLPQ